MAMRNDRKYVPSEAAVKLAWADRRLFLDSVGGGDPSPDAVYNAEFDRFLARVRRDAWDEGFQDGRRYDGEGDDGPRYTNPYSGQDADQ